MTNLAPNNSEVSMTNLSPNVNENENKSTIHPSGISHGFDTAYAIAYGVNEAIMIRTLQFFITANAVRGKHVHEGRNWTYDTMEDFPKHFPYWTKRQVRHTMDSLIKQGVIIKGRFSKDWSNRTCWYAFSDEDAFIQNPNKKPTPPTDVVADLPNLANDNCQNWQMTNDKFGKCYKSSSISIAISPSSSPPTPSTGDSPAVESASDFSASEKPKKKKLPSIFSDKVVEFSKKMVDILSKACEVYRAPADMTKFYESVRIMLEDEQQDPDILLKAFTWACNDHEINGEFNGWSRLMYAKRAQRKPTNPADRLHAYMTSINQSMKARKTRKIDRRLREKDGSVVDEYKDLLF